MDLNSALIPDSDIRHLGMLPDTACGNEVQGFDVGLGRGDDDIGIGTHTINDSTTPLKAHGDLPLGIGTAGNVVDRIQLQVTARIHQDSIALKVASTGPLPSASTVCSSPSTVRVSFALGTTPVSEQTCMHTSP